MDLVAVGGELFVAGTARLENIARQLKLKEIKVSFGATNKRDLGQILNMSVHNLGEVDRFETGLSLQTHGVTEPELDAPVLRVGGLTVPHEILSVLSGQAFVLLASICSPSDVAGEDRLNTVEE